VSAVQTSCLETQLEAAQAVEAALEERRCTVAGEHDTVDSSKWKSCLLGQLSDLGQVAEVMSHYIFNTFNSETPASIDDLTSQKIP
jgi:hypothetical protein